MVSIIKGETSPQEAARKHGLTVAEVEEWRERFLAAAENALRSDPRDEEGQREEAIKKLKQKVGELVLEERRPQGGGETLPPFGRGTSDE